MESFTATDDSLAAARMVLEAVSSSNVLKIRYGGASSAAGWSGPKPFFASMVNGGLTAVNAMITARQLIVDGLRYIKCGNLLPIQRFDLQ